MGFFDFFRKRRGRHADPELQAIEKSGRDPTVEEYLEVARRLRDGGDPQAAVDVARQALVKHLDSVELSFLLAECLLQSGETAEAVDHYQDISDEWRDDLAVQRRCSRGLIACQDWLAAEMQFYVASETFPDDAELHLLQAEAEERSGEAKIALATYRLAWELAREDEAVREAAARKIEELGGEAPGREAAPRDSVPQAASSAPPADAQAVDQQAVDEHVQQMIELPDGAFFLMLLRDVLRALAANERHAAQAGSMPPVARELLESHAERLEIAAGIRPDRSPERDDQYFTERIDEDDSFEVQMMTQRYRFMTAHVQFQVSTDPVERSARKREMMQANDVLFVLNSERFGWDYVPLALQTAADLESLVTVQQRGNPETLERLASSPFADLFSERKLADRLIDPAAFGLSDSHRGDRREPSGKGSGPGILIDLPGPSGDPWVDECFGLEIREIPDDRQYYEMDDFASSLTDIMQGPADGAVDLATKLKDDYPDFDVSYGWLADVLARRGDADAAIETLLEGLEKANLKGPICHSLGLIWLEKKERLKPAVMWWLRSCAIQLGGGAAVSEHAFLNLATIADSYPPLDAESAWLLEQGDRINPQRIRFTVEGREIRHRLAVDQADASILRGIQVLHRHYGGS